MGKSSQEVLLIIMALNGMLKVFRDTLSDIVEFRHSVSKSHVRGSPDLLSFICSLMYEAAYTLKWLRVERNIIAGLFLLVAGGVNRIITQGWRILSVRWC
jgi:hypothetical protein